ncbi:MAG: GNAT family N-acetyltransferase [Pseudomonadota bacterium]
MSILAIDIRRAVNGDSFGISAVHDASWRQAYSGIIPHKSLDTMVRRRDPKWWERAIRHSTRIFVLESQGQIIGYTTLGANRVSALKQEGEVYELYLLPEFQGVGLGKKLFLQARSELNRMGLSGCVVWALEDNEPACAFYENAGGRAVAEGCETFGDKQLNKLAFVWN